MFEELMETKKEARRNAMYEGMVNQIEQSMNDLCSESPEFLKAQKSKRTILETKGFEILDIDLAFLALQFLKWERINEEKAFYLAARKTFKDYGLSKITETITNTSTIWESQDEFRVSMEEIKVVNDLITNLILNPDNINHLNVLCPIYFTAELYLEYEKPLILFDEAIEEIRKKIVERSPEKLNHRTNCY
jgi:hypothetical protein